MWHLCKCWLNALRLSKNFHTRVLTALQRYVIILSNMMVSMDIMQEILNVCDAGVTMAQCAIKAHYNVISQQYPLR